jgi:hypothetical protein
MSVLRLKPADQPSAALSPGLGIRYIPIILLSLLSIFDACGWMSTLPSDARMEANFRQNKPDFEALVKMFNEDSRVTAVHLQRTELVSDARWPRDDIGFSQARWGEYRRIFKKLGLQFGIDRWSEPPGTIAFLADGSGMVAAGELKGYVYCPGKPPSPLVRSLDHGVPANVPPPVAPHTTATAFKQIETSWYLFYSEY